jgi:hypothetical protein
MERLFRWIGILFVLFLVLRVSLARRGKSFGLGLGPTLLNLATGGLAGLILSALAGARGGPGAGPLDPAGGGDPFVAAMISILPFLGATLGGLGGYLALGALGQKLSATLAADSIVRLRRVQIGVCVVLVGAWILIRMGV